MKVILYPADEGGCGYYRMQQPGRVALMEGLDVTLETEIPGEVEVMPVDGSVRYTASDDIEADVVVFQRPALDRLADYIEQYQARGIACVVEIDDDLSSLDPRAPGFSAYAGRVKDNFCWRHARKAASIADLVTVTTPALAERFAPHGRCAILPNCVPEAMLSMPHESDGKTMGWGGAVYFHAGDMEITHGGVQLALNDTDWRFLKIGAGAEIVQYGFSLKERPDMTGPHPIEEYHPQLGQLDIGVVPLAPTRFNEGKSYLKGIEYAALQVPFVASPTADYVYLHERFGLGLLAKDRGRNWKSALRRLMDEPQLRAEMAQAGHECVRQHHTYEGQGWRWVEAWQEAIGNREAAMQRRAA